MPNKGLDSNVDLTHHAACLFEKGYRWAGRYVKRMPSALSRSEALALSDAGLWVVSLVEIGFPTTPEHFTHQQGLSDGRFAYSYAQENLHQPRGAPLYFCIDYDASLKDLQGPITSYFLGVLDAFHSAAGHEDPAYPIGVYGSGLTCATLSKHLPVTYTWLAMSRGWRGSKAYEGWSIKQTVGAAVCGCSIDEDISSGAGGGWKLT